MFRSLLSSSKRLPDPVLSDLVDILFASLVPTAVMGITIAVIGTLIALKTRDGVVWGLVIAGVLAIIGRGLLISAYHRQKEGLQRAEPARIWERRYAIANHPFAALLGLLNARALMTGDPLVAMLITAMTVGLRSALVARFSFPPRIWVVGLALAVVPTFIALAAVAIVSDHYARAA